MSHPTPSYSAAEKLKYGLPPIKTIDNVSANANGEIIYVEPYRFHSYHVSGTTDASGYFNIYATNGEKDQADGYKLVARYGMTDAGATLNQGGLMYSDDWYFKYAKTVIDGYAAGTITVIERHGP